MRPVPSELILAIDVGAGSLRAGLVGVDGRVAASATVALAIAEPRPGWAELDPEQWWDALLVAASRVLRKAPRAARVLGVCICGLTRTQVMLDKRRRPLGPAILFRDRRAAEVARAMSGTTAFDAQARLAWIARHQPARFRRIDAVVEPKDFLRFKLTGVLATDASAPREPAAPWQQAGVVQRSEPLARIVGVPVFAGAMDTWASAVGAGAVRPGQAYDIAGTSEAVGLVTARPATAPGLVSLAWTEDAYQIGGPTQAGADCAKWCHATFRIRDRLEDAVDRVSRAAPRADRPLFLPYLAGERAPVWNSEVRGAFHGVGRNSGPDDFLWAVLEGVAMAVRDILDHAQAGADVRATELRVAGGGARSAAWCRMKADVTGMPVFRSTEPETGVIGAAIAASVGLGVYDTIGMAADRMVRRGQRFAPRGGRAGLFDARASRYRQIKEAALALGRP
jgi:xylulokinase